jgi:hypothetical protein
VNLSCVARKRILLLVGLVSPLVTNQLTLARFPVMMTPCASTATPVVTLLVDVLLLDASVVGN